MRMITLCLSNKHNNRSKSSISDRRVFPTITFLPTCSPALTARTFSIYKIIFKALNYQKLQIVVKNVIIIWFLILAFRFQVGFVTNIVLRFMFQFSEVPIEKSVHNFIFIMTDFVKN